MYETMRLYDCVEFSLTLYSYVPLTLGLSGQGGVEED